jgi:hypothetical protein
VSPPSRPKGGQAANAASPRMLCGAGPAHWSVARRSAARLCHRDRFDSPAAKPSNDHVAAGPVLKVHKIAADHDVMIDAPRELGRVLTL